MHSAKNELISFEPDRRLATANTPPMPRLASLTMKSFLE
jgi:hypothetical protein